MAHIYVYSPAGAVRDKAAFKRAVKRIEELGHGVEIDPDALTSYQRFAGDDNTRIKAIERAAASQADLTLITRGGYGLTRLLGQINYRQIVKSIQRGTHWMGFSDFSALQAALYAKTQNVTISGAALVSDFGAPSGSDELTQACFDDVLLKQNEGAGWRLPAADIRYLTASGRGGKTDAGLRHQTLQKKGILWGGNLTVLSSLLGTPYFPNIEGGILWFEETGESPYRIERMLTQWLHSGILAKQKMIIIGQVTHANLHPHDRGFNLAQVLTWLRSQLKIPVITALPFGHTASKIMLPFGVPVESLFDGKEFVLLWNL